MDRENFNFDLDRMKEAIESPSHTMPSNLSFEEFQEWIKNHTENKD
jgi:hypothetical protein